MNKVLVATAMALLLFCGCGKRATETERSSASATGATAPEQSPVKLLQDQLAEALWERVLPTLEEMSRPEMLQTMNNLARQQLSPHRELFIKAAEEQLARMPKAAPVDRSKWVAAQPPMTMKAAVTAFSTEVASLTSSTQPENGYGRDLIYFTTTWSPVRVATFCRMATFSRIQAVEQLSKRAQLEAIAPPQVMALDANPASPVILIKTGPEAFIVTLQRGEDNAYLPADVEWLRRK